MATHEHIKMVAGVYRMIINGGYLVEIIGQPEQEIIDKMGGLDITFTDLCKLLKKCSLAELRIRLYSFALIITTNDKSMMENLKLAIHFIERDLSFLINDNRRALYGRAKY